MSRFWVLCLFSTYYYYYYYYHHHQQQQQHKEKQFFISSAAKYLCLSSFSRQLKMGKNESNSKTYNDSPSLPGEESVALGSLPSGSTSRQYPESGPSTSTQNLPLKEERIEIRLHDTGKQIYEALERGDHKALSKLLNNCKTKVHPMHSKGNTALHEAVRLACQKGDRDGSLFQCIDVLMKCGQVNINRPNNDGCTAIGLAVNGLHKTCVEYMLKHPSADRLYLDYYPGDSEYTVREIILETYPDLEPLLPPPRLERMDSPERDIKLLAALQRDEYNIFIETLDRGDPNPWYDEPYHSYLLEVACQMKNRQQFVELLLVRGADPNIKNPVTGMTVLHATARSENLDLLEWLLNKDTMDVAVKDNEHRTILHWWARISEKNPDENKRVERCFRLILQKSFDKNRSFKDQDISGNTPFSFAVDRKYRDRILLMLDTKYDDITFAHIVQVLESTNKSLLEAILDYCFDSNDEPTNSEKLKVNLKVNPLLTMSRFAVNSNHVDLFKHPVLSIFVKVMWKALKIYFLLNVAFYVTFLFSLTAYILFSKICNPQNNRDVANDTNNLLSDNDSNVTCGMSDARRYIISQGLWYPLIVLLGLLCVREGCQLITYRKRYIIKLENWLELLLIFVSFISCSGIVDSIEVNRHFFAIAILLGWFELVLILGRLPRLSFQTEVFKIVSRTFLRFMAGYIILILAFAFSFFILFEKSTEEDEAVLFTNPFLSILKTIVMFAGEFEYSSLPFNTVPGTSHVIFLLFVLFVAIVLLNLLSGLAVGDTRKFIEDEERLIFLSRLRLISYCLEVYLALSDILERYRIFEEADYELFPNKDENIGPNDRRILQRIINEKRERNKKENETEHVENWKVFAETLSMLRSESKEMQQMLKKILTHLNIPEH